MGPVLHSVLLAAAAAVLVSDRGLVYEPALSPDGKQVVWARADEDGTVSLLGRAVEDEGPGKELLVFGEGPDARRLAMQSLIEGPWSPDGAWLAVLSPGVDPGTVRLELLRPDGSERHPVGPGGGKVLAAGWLDADTLVLAHQGSDAATPQILRVGTAEDASPERLAAKLPEGARVLDLAVAPGGEWIALAALVGKPTERSRALFAIQLADGATQRLGPDAVTERANMMRWVRTDKGLRLYLTAVGSHQLAYWDAGSEQLTTTADRIETAQPVAKGAWVVARSTDDTLEAIFVGTDVRNRLGSGFVATSSAGSRLALVRTADPGAAVLVAEASEEGLLSGEIGVPDLLAPEPATPEQPEGGEGIEQPEAATPSAPVVAEGGEAGEGEQITPESAQATGGTQAPEGEGEPAVAAVTEGEGAEATGGSEPGEGGEAGSEAAALTPEQQLALDEARLAAEQASLENSEHMAEQEAIEEARRLAEEAKARQPIAGFERGPEGTFSLEEVVTAEPERRQQLVGQPVSAEGRVVRIRRPVLGGRKPLLRVRLGDGTLVTVEPIDWKALAPFERGDRIAISGTLGNEEGTLVTDADVRRIGARSIFELLPESPNERRRERR